MLPNDDDAIEAAIRRVCSGDTAAFEVVVRQHERLVRTWLSVHAPPGVDVDDLAQRSFLAAFTRLNEYTPGTHFTAWLLAITRFQLRTETTRLRRIADYHTRYAPDLLQRALDQRSEETPEIWSTRLEHLQSCLRCLDKSLRQYITWRYADNLPLEEMASRCDRSVGAIKKQLWKIRQKLQQCVESRMEHEGGLS
ncbi:sigma-70 family RNA polymerase sigma factor [Lignipirellula cremea]|nr:sigma-70 family RNA polymerase sigma factor [Lignipirellula cremea]